MREKKPMRIVVHHGRCQGHAMCVFTAPEIFVLDEFGYNRMQPFEIKPGQEGAAAAGAASCPELAIEIIDDE